MFNANRDLDDPNNAEISAELEALLSHGHINHESPFEGECISIRRSLPSDLRAQAVDNRSADHYLFTGNEEDILDEDSLPFDVEIDANPNGTIESTLLGNNDGDGEHYRLEGMTAVNQENDVKKASIDGLEGDNEEFRVEKRSPVNHTTGSSYLSPCGTTDINAEHTPNKSFDGATFEVTVDHLEPDGNYLPETINDDVEIATEHLHLAEDVALFGTPPTMDNSHERLIDDETLDRLKEEMKRMDQERNHATLHPRNDASTQHSNALPPYSTLSSPGHHQQNAFAGPSTYQNLQPGATLGRNHSPFSANNNDSSDLGAIFNSDASHLFEIPASHQKPPRRRMTNERRDSTGSSGSKHLIPLCEETGKRMMIKDRMDQLAVS